jgi:hypothetical protein
MSYRLAVLLVHGMGAADADYSRGLVDRLRRRLGRDLAGRVEFEACHWSPVLQGHQDRVWQKLLASRKPMDQKWARKWVVSALGDPVGYLSGYLQAGEPVYLKVHECLRASLAALEQRLDFAAGTPLLVLAHSLGSVVVSNYLWNEQRASGEVTPAAPSRTVPGAAEKRAPMGRTPFERMETLTTLVTYGSTIPLFLPPVEPIECVRLPRETLPPQLRSVARWLNVYDPDDLLGYPLANVWDDTKGTVIEDVTVNAGIFPLSETPLSHGFYDRDAGFVRLVAAEMQKVLDVPDQGMPGITASWMVPPAP